MPSFRGQPVDVVIDVRSRPEFWMGHLEGAVCIPVDSLVTALPKRRDVTHHSRILLYCASGARSAAGTAALESLGYTNVIDGGPIGEARAEYQA